VTPGGSLLNTLVGLSRLGASASTARPLRIAMAGCVGGGDGLGAYVRQQLRGAGVAVITPDGAPDDVTMMSSSPAAAAPAGGAAGGAAKPQGVVIGADPQAQARPAPKRPGGTTGTVMVFCTPDAQRSFLSCIPNDDAVALSPELLRAAARSRLLVIEG
jgi:sugar/nucleoside kinase (ribokinase family)